MSISRRLGPKNKSTYKPYGLTKAEEMDLPWKHDKFNVRENTGNIQSSNKKHSVLIENLHPSASVDDIKASFSHLGNIIDADYRLVIDQSGGHVGSCVLSFDRKDAVDAAIVEFDQKLADGNLILLNLRIFIKGIAC